MQLTKIIAICTLFLSFSHSIFAQVELNEITPPQDISQESSADEIKSKNYVSFTDSVILGLVEGMTEYLPVSSTGHLLLANAFLKLDSEEPLLDNQGTVITDKYDRPYSLKRVTDAYAIVIQFGAILAVALLYWPYILKMIFGFLGKNPEGLHLARNLIIAFLPAAVIGLLFNNIIEEYLFGVKPVIMALVGGAILMMIVQKLYDKHSIAKSSTKKMENMTVGQSLLVGFMQCVAMWPGTSRSMMTILGGYLSGLKPAESARFSFLLGLVTLSAASFYKTYKDGSAILEVISVGPLAAGLIVAFISAAISVKWMIGFLTKKGLTPFAWYRIIIAAILVALMYFNLL